MDGLNENFICSTKVLACCAMSDVVLERHACETVVRAEIKLKDIQEAGR